MLKNTPDRLARYLAGSLTEDENAHILAWLRTRPGLRRELEGLSSMSVPDVEDVLARIAEHTPHPVGRRLAGERPARRSWRRRSAVGLGLSLIFFVGIVSVFVVRSPGEERTYETADGARNAFTLDDGSAVVLNAGSRLTVSRDFGKRERLITLDGEAFFTVRADSERTFVIRTSRMSITVVGTAFNVDAHYGEAPAVVVAQGRVRVQSATGHDAELGPGERGRLHHSSGRILTDRTSVADALAWKEGRLVFRGTPMRDVAPRLEREFGVRVVLDPNLASKRLDASFNQGRIEAVATLIAAALNVDATIDGRTVIFAGPEEMP